MIADAEFINGVIFDGCDLHEDASLTIYNGVIKSDGSGRAPRLDLQGDILAPGFVDLQVNGGGGVNLNDAPKVSTIRRIAAAHRGLGATTILPTLITDRPETTTAAIAACRAALSEGVPGIAGLHLEGPHLARDKCGAHEPALIRPMTDRDLAELCDAAAQLPLLKVTIAPESVSPQQVALMSECGIYVALGHTNCDAQTALRYFEAGARGVTHLFNAMSQMTSRAPGLVGAALSHSAWSGLIADGVHVDPVAMRVALAANPHMFLVSDAMAVAGTDATEFTLGDRRILRQNKELRLEDDTLAGADLDLARAVSVLFSDCGMTLTDALSCATRRPAEAAGLGGGIGRLQPGTLFRALRLRQEAGGLRLVEVYG